MLSFDQVLAALHKVSGTAIGFFRSGSRRYSGSDTLEDVLCLDFLGADVDEKTLRRLLTKAGIRGLQVRARLACTFTASCRCWGDGRSLATTLVEGSLATRHRLIGHLCLSCRQSRWLMFRSTRLQCTTEAGLPCSLPMRRTLMKLWTSEATICSLEQCYSFCCLLQLWSMAIAHCDSCLKSQAG